jgi:hypothetical protein
MPKPPEGMGGMGGAGEDDAACPMARPMDKSDCTDALECDYPQLVCRCEGPEAGRTWRCTQPPKPMNQCPPMPPKDAAACKTAEPPSPPCHYDEAGLDCACAADKWKCTEAP